MKEVAISLRFRLLLAVAALAAGWMIMGPFGLVFFSPIAGICLARPLLDKMASLYYGARASALQQFQGKYFAFRGVRFDVYEDEQEQLWLRTADVRTLLPSFPRDGVLLKVCDSGLMPDHAKGQGMRVRADTLDRLLSTSRQLETIKFRNWLQKEVADSKLKCNTLPEGEPLHESHLYPPERRGTWRDHGDEVSGLQHAQHCSGAWPLSEHHQSRTAAKWLPAGV